MFFLTLNSSDFSQSRAHTHRNNKIIHALSNSIKRITKTEKSNNLIQMIRKRTDFCSEPVLSKDSLPMSKLVKYILAKVYLNLHWLHQLSKYPSSIIFLFILKRVYSNYELSIKKRKMNRLSLCNNGCIFFWYLIYYHLL